MFMYYKRATGSLDLFSSKEDKHPNVFYRIKVKWYWYSGCFAAVIQNSIFWRL